MTRREALIALRNAVRDGTLGDPVISEEAWEIIERPFRDQENATRVVDAYDGSLDAALALHEALAPGWSWHKPAVPWEADSFAVQDPNWTEGDDEDDGGYAWFKGSNNTQARAWLLALLEMLIAKEPKDE